MDPRNKLDFLFFGGAGVPLEAAVAATDLDPSDFLLGEDDIVLY